MPFDKIPGPKGLPLVHTALDYTPFRGFDITRIHELWVKRHQKYGDIYKEKMGSKCEIWKYEPSRCAAVVFVLF